MDRVATAEEGDIASALHHVPRPRRRQCLVRQSKPHIRQSRPQYGTRKTVKARRKTVKPRYKTVKIRYTTVKASPSAISTLRPHAAGSAWWCRGGLVCQAHTLVYHSAQGSRTWARMPGSYTLVSPSVRLKDLGSYVRLLHSCITQLKAQGPWLVCQAHRLLYHSSQGSRTF